MQILPKGRGVRPNAMHSASLPAASKPLTATSMRLKQQQTPPKKLSLDK